MARHTTNSLGAVLNVHHRTPARSVRTNCLTQAATRRGASSSRMARRPSSCWKTSTCAGTTSTPANSANPGHLYSRTTITSRSWSAAPTAVSWLSSPAPIEMQADIGVHDTQSHELVTGPLHVPYPVDNATFSPEGTRLYVSGGEDGDVIAYSIPDGNIAGHLDGFPRHPDSTFEWTTAGLAFVEGDLLAVGSTTGPVRLVDPSTLADVGSLPFPPGKSNLLQHSTAGGAFSGRGRLGGSDGISGHRRQGGTSMRRRSLATKFRSPIRARSRIRWVVCTARTQQVGWRSAICRPGA